MLPCWAQHAAPPAECQRAGTGLLCCPAQGVMPSAGHTINAFTHTAVTLMEGLASAAALMQLMQRPQPYTIPGHSLQQDNTPRTHTLTSPKKPGHETWRVAQPLYLCHYDSMQPLGTPKLETILHAP